MSKLNLFPEINSVPNIDSIVVNESGGSLSTGVYFVAIAYKNKVLTNFITISDPIYIANEALSKPGTGTSKSINLSLSNLDNSYKRLQLALIPYESSVLKEVLYLPEYGFSGNTKNITITGSESDTFGAIDEIVIDNAFYEKVKTLKFTDNVLYLGGVTKSTVDIGYQQHANNIKTYCVKETTEFTQLDSINYDSQLDTTNLTFRKQNFDTALFNETFKRGEVYAFYISFLLKNGSETKAYHIPGREPTGGNTGVGTKLNYTISIPNSIDELTATPSKVTLKGNINYDPNMTSFITLKLEIGNTSYNRDFVYSNDNQVIGKIEELVNEFAIQNTVTNNSSGNTFDFRFNIPVGPYTVMLNDTSARFNIDPIDYSIEQGVSESTTHISTITVKTFSSISEINVERTISSATTNNTILNELETIYNNSPGLTANRVNDTVVVETMHETDAFNDSFEFEFGWYQSFFNIVKNQQGVTPNYDNAAEMDTGLYDNIQPNIKKYQIDSVADDTYNMGYWENVDEQYPSIAEDTNGDFSGLNGKNVRHHRIPYNIRNNNYDKLFRIGVQFKNITVPDEAISYKIYAAKKEDSNKIHIASGKTSAVRKWDLGETSLRLQMREFGDYNYDYDERQTPFITTGESLYQLDKYGVLSFDALSNRKDISTVNYVRKEHTTVEANPNGINNADWKEFVIKEGNDRRSVLKLYFHNGYEDENTKAEDDVDYDARLDNRPTIHKVDVKSYIDNNIDAVNIKGTDNFIANKEQVSFVYIEGEPLANINDFNTNIQSSVAEGTPTTEQYDFNQELFSKHMENSQLMLCSLKNNIHFPYYNQELVQIHTGTAQDTPVIFKGQCYLNFHYMKEYSKKNNIMTAVHGFVIESWYNILFRQQGDKFHETYLPLGPMRSVVNPLEDYDANADNHRDFDDYLEYDEDFNRHNNLKNPGIFNVYDEEFLHYPTRVVRSNSIDENEEFRVFKQEDKLDLNRDRGDIVKLETFRNTLFIHCERGMFLTKGKDNLSTDENTVYVGSGDIFQNFPSELVATPLGFGGIQHPYHSISSEYGYFFADELNKKLFKFNDSIVELSEINYGMKNVLSNMSSVNSIGVDPEYKRLLFSFDDKTLSFNINLDSFISYHSYKPNFIITTLNNFYTTFNNELYLHGVNDRGLFYNTRYDLFVEFIKSDVNFTKASNILMIGETLHDNSSIDLEGSYQVLNSYQDTSKQDFILFPNPNSNIRRTGKNWRINKIRDNNDNWYDKKPLTDKYHKVRLWFRNNGNNLIYLSLMDIITKGKLR